MLDWGDIRIFLAVQREGSFSAGARVLRIDQTTAGRRVAALQAAVGARLFRRGRDGISLTAAGVTAEIDLALWMVERLASRDIAERVRRTLEWTNVAAIAHGA